MTLVPCHFVFPQVASGVRGAMNYHVKVTGNPGDNDKIRDIVERMLLKAESVFSLWIEVSGDSIYKQHTYLDEDSMWLISHTYAGF